MTEFHLRIEGRRLAENMVKTRDKKLFHSRGRRLLKHYAEQLLQLPKEDFVVRSCHGGPEVLGEAILHSKQWYFQIFWSHNGYRVMYRKCQGLSDCTGGQNRYTTPMLLPDLSRERLEALVR